MASLRLQCSLMMPAHCRLSRKAYQFVHDSAYADRGHHTPNPAAIMHVLILQDSEGDLLLAKEDTPEHAAEAQSEQQRLNIRQGGEVMQSIERQAEQSRNMQRVQQVQHMQLLQQAHEAASMDYDSLPRPSPYPLEGDVIAYRLLHIGADWTPQVGLPLVPSFLPRGDRSSTLYPALLHFIARSPCTFQLCLPGCCILQDERDVQPYLAP